MCCVWDESGGLGWETCVCVELSEIMFLESEKWIPGVEKLRSEVWAHGIGHKYTLHPMDLPKFNTMDFAKVELPQL